MLKSNICYVIAMLLATIVLYPWEDKDSTDCNYYKVQNDVLVKIQNVLVEVGLEVITEGQIQLCRMEEYHPKLGGQ